MEWTETLCHEPTALACKDGGGIYTTIHIFARSAPAEHGMT